MFIRALNGGDSDNSGNDQISDESMQDSVNLGIGIGLGLGIPIVMALILLRIYWVKRQKDSEKSKGYRVMEKG
jgi:hypothetical protein